MIRTSTALVAVLVAGNAAWANAETSKDDDSFTLDTGARELTVETDRMVYDPLDDEGYQKIEKGDIVSVTGNLDSGLFGEQQVEASAITTLFDSGGS